MLQELQLAGLQSDQRYTEDYIRSRVERGYGPLRIAMELRQRGVAEEQISDCMETCDVNWVERITAVRSKKFGPAVPANYPAIMKQSGFLKYRGFSADLIRKLFRQGIDD